MYLSHTIAVFYRVAEKRLSGDAIRATHNACSVLRGNDRVFVLAIPFFAGTVLQVICAILRITDVCKWVIWAPAVLGLSGLVSSLILLADDISVTVILIYWAVLFLWLWLCSAKVDKYKIKVVAEYVHDDSAYTQGLSFDGDRFIETTGQCGESSIRLVPWNQSTQVR